MINFNKCESLRSLSSIVEEAKHVRFEDDSREPDLTDQFYCEEFNCILSVHPAYGILFQNSDLDIMGLYGLGEFGDLGTWQVPTDLESWIPLSPDHECWVPVEVSQININSVT